MAWLWIPKVPYLECVSITRFVCQLNMLPEKQKATNNFYLWLLSVLNFFKFMKLKPIHTTRNGNLLSRNPGRIIGS